jgi:hypothetical protein
MSDRLVLLVTFIKRQSSDFAVTNKRVKMKVGVLSTRSVELLPTWIALSMPSFRILSRLRATRLSVLMASHASESRDRHDALLRFVLCQRRTWRST